LFAIAVAAIYRPAFTGLERYFGVFAALGTHRRIHLPLAPETIATTTLAARSSCLTARGTALRVIHIPFGSEELLFFSTECETCATITAIEGSVLIYH